MNLLITVYEYSSRHAWVQITGVEVEKLFAPVPVVQNFFGNRTRVEVEGATVAHFLAAVNSYVEPAEGGLPKNFMVFCNNPAREQIYFEDETEACNFASARNIPVYERRRTADPKAVCWSIAFGNWD